MRALGAQLRLPEAAEVERGNNVLDSFIDGIEPPTSETLEKMIMRLEQLSANATPS